MDRRLLSWMKLFCLFSLIVGVAPITASRAVCVMPHRAVMPMATCGMSCCAHGAMRADASRSCCNPLHQVVTPDPRAGEFSDSKSCRAERRLISLVSPAAWVPAIGFRFAHQVALLPRVIFHAFEEQGAAEPQLFERDPRPPGLFLTLERPGRSPPPR